MPSGDLLMCLCVDSWIVVGSRWPELQGSPGRMEEREEWKGGQQAGKCPSGAGKG